MTLGVRGLVFLTGGADIALTGGFFSRGAYLSIEKLFHISDIVEFCEVWKEFNLIGCM